MRRGGADGAAAQGELLLDRRRAAGPPPRPTLPGRPSAAARLLRGVDRSPGACLAGLAEAVLVALLGFQCVALYAAAVTPAKSPPATGEPARHHPPSALLTAHDSVFGSGGGVAAPPLQATALELHGVRQEGRGRGSAIISEGDGPQRSIAVGESISPGLVLKDVGPGYATLARQGVDERLAFADFAAPVSAARPRPMPPARAMATASPRSDGPAARGSSINFADPSTLPASLTQPGG